MCRFIVRDEQYYGILAVFNVNVGASVGPKFSQHSDAGEVGGLQKRYLLGLNCIFLASCMLTKLRLITTGFWLISAAAEVREVIGAESGYAWEMLESGDVYGPRR
jgi:hypothetical protein